MIWYWLPEVAAGEENLAMAGSGSRLPRFTASILVLVCIATVDAAVFNDWVPDDFSYVTAQSDSSGTC